MKQLGASVLLVLTATGCAEDPPARSPDAASGSEARASGSSIICKGKPEVGKPAPVFGLSSMNGAGKAGVEQGKVTLVDFWATWCKPCEKSFPKYQELYVKYKASGLAIIAVSVDEADKKNEIPGFGKTHGDVKFPLGWDSDHKIADCYDVKGMPSAYVIDKKGIVRFVHTKFETGEEKKVEEEIKGLL
jgi:peroxiredoxin